MIDSPNLSDDVIESLPVGDPQRARAWLIGGTQAFSPPTPSWYYIYVTSQPTTFRDGSTVLLRTGEPAVTIFPPGLNHSAGLDGLTFVFGVSSPSAEIDPSAWPRTATVARIEKVVSKLGYAPLRLIVSRRLKSEAEWEDRDWSLEEVGGVLTRQVLVSPEGGFEFSVANENTSQSPHSREKTFEAFASAHTITSFWREEGKEHQAAEGPTVVVVSPPTCRMVALSGTTYMLQVSADGSGLGDDRAPCKIS